MRWKISDLGGRNLLEAHLRLLAGVGADVLLQDGGVGVLLVAHRALREGSHGWLGPVHAHVGLQVALGGEGPLADLALEGPLTGVSTVVHLQGRLAGQNSVAN